MFETFLEDCVTGPESLLDERLRANELEVRRLAAERAALNGVIEQRGFSPPNTGPWPRTCGPP